MWTGIILNGNINSFDAAGKLVITDATVRDAHTAVNALWGVLKFNWTYTGTIQATNANFINNRVGIQMEGRDFSRSNSSINSFITSCQFLCNAPLLDIATYAGEGTKNFIQLESVRQLYTINNNTFTGYTTLTPDKRGTGISSLNSNFTPQGNTFTGLTRGIESGVTDVSRQIVADGNTFTNVQQGIYDANSIADIFTNNHFTFIPSADALGSHTYGIYMLSSGGFDISGNDYSGTSSTAPLTAGSHGIAFDNTGFDGGVCFNNTFSGTDFAIHTQNDNQNLKVRCNQFAVGGTAHNSSAWYTESGLLKQQGLSACSTTPEDAAGNRWLSTSSSGVQDVFTNINIIYFANPLDQFSSPTTVPSAISAIFTGLNTSCANQTISSCTDPAPGLVQGGGNGLRSHISDSLGYYAQEQQLEENSLLRQYLQSDDFTDYETLLTGSGSAESQKLLSQYYLGIKNYANSRAALSNIASITASEVANQDSITGASNTFENINFCKYMNCMIDLGEAGKTIPELNATQLSTLHDVANSHVKISASAEAALTIALNEHYTHPIIKGENVQNRANQKTKSIQNISKKGDLSIYPNPFSEITTVEYVIPENTQNSVIYLYDAIGNQIRTYPIASTGNGKLLIDGSALKNGIYSCRLVSDNKTIGVSKLVIIK